MRTKIRVLLADDHEPTRKGLRRLLELEKDIQVVGEASSGPETILLDRRLHPDIVVLDISMPVQDGLQVAQQLLSRNSLSRIVFLSVYDSSDFVNAGIEMGVGGYLLKDDAIDHLPAVIRRVATGEKGFFSRHLIEGNHMPGSIIPVGDGQ